MTESLTWYVEYEVVSAVELASWVYGAARVDAVVGRCHADDFDAAVALGESHSLTAKQSAQPNKSTVQSIDLSYTTTQP